MMGRPLRIEYAGAYYHVAARGNEQKDIFKSRKDREKFLSYLGSAVSRYGAVIHGYCLMSNHYHLLLETPSGNLSQIMQHLNGAYTNYFNTKRSRSGHLFQGRFQAILIEADEYSRELSRYIHLNPVRAGIVTKPEDYQWSSYRDYIGVREPPAWLHTQSILSCFHQSIPAAQEKYCGFVEDLLGREYQSPLKGAVASTLLGSCGFVQEITEKHIAGKPVDRDLPALRALSKRPSIDKIIETTERLLPENKRLATQASIYLCHKYSGAQLKEISERFGVGQSAISQASRRFALQLEKDPGLKKTIAQLEGAVSMSRV